SAGEDGLVNLWNLHGNEPRVLAGHRGGVNCVAFSPDGQLLATAGGSYKAPGEVKLWDVARGRGPRSLAGPGNELLTPPVAPAGQTLVPAGYAGSIRVGDLPAGRARHVLRGHLGAVWSVAFGLGGLALFSGSDDGTIRQWDPRDGVISALYEGETF